MTAANVMRMTGAAEHQHAYGQYDGRPAEQKASNPFMLK
jgi:hypothetical protein